MMDIAQAYDAVYVGLRKSPTLQRIWREHALGAAYPNGFEHLSFLTVSELRRLAATLQIRPGETLVDLACGAGGPALWIAKATSARLVGIDASHVAVAHARDRANDLDLSSVARFTAGCFDQLPLRSLTADAIMSVDALHYAPDKVAAFAECARILRAGRRLALTAFEIDGSFDKSGLPDPFVMDFCFTIEDSRIVGLSIRFITSSRIVHNQNNPIGHRPQALLIPRRRVPPAWGELHRFFSLRRSGSFYATFEPVVT